MRRVLHLRIEAFPGASIEDVAYELCRVATQLGVTCTLVFNGLELMAVPGDDANRLLSAFNETSKQNAGKHNIVRGGPKE